MKKMLFLLIFLVSNMAAADVNYDIAEQNIPKDFSKLKSLTREGQPLRDGEVNIALIKESFGKKDGSYYLVVNYQAYGELFKLIVIEVDKNGSHKVIQDVAQKLTVPEDCKFDVADLDGDGTNELIKEGLDDRGNVRTNYIFKWKNGKLVDITPIENWGADEMDSLLINMYYTDFKVNGKPLIINNDGSRYLYQLSNDGSFVSLGKFAHIFFVSKETKKITLHNEVVNVKEGTYTLEVKNLSEHKHAVRAEISVNGNIVLKPEDFCTEKPKKKFEKRKDKHGKFAAEDDDDDQDEDGCKRCQMKKDVYADVKMNATNTISVKLYGNKHSRIQVTLKKKN